MMRILITVLLLVCGVPAVADQSGDELLTQLQGELALLSTQVTALNKQLRQVQETQRAGQVQNVVMQQQFAALRPGYKAGTSAVVVENLDTPGSEQKLVDLSDQNPGQTLESSPSHVLANPWWQNIEVWGFGAAGYYDTGSGATRHNGSFEVKEATLFIEAAVWENTSFFIELQTNRLGADDAKFTRTGEVYIHQRDVLVGDNHAVGLKLGRIDIPFGEEYLWQDAIDNPLITNSASYPYGWDEGLLAYGNWYELNWIAALTDGSDARSSDENTDKAVNFKLYGDLVPDLYLSASYMYNGDNIKSAIEFGGSHFQPVKDSAVGTSASSEVNSDLFELNAKYSFELASMRAYLALTAGLANQDDRDSPFNRNFRWFTVEPFIAFSQSLYGVVRYSEIGTYDDDEGFHFDGKTFAGGNDTFGFDSKRFRRLGVGVGWQPNPRTRAKLEIGRDWFELIDAFAAPKDDDRNFIGVEIAVGF